MGWGAYGLVRDKDGKPRFDNINNIHAGIWNLLTETEKAQIIKERQENK